jgi:hypothetical protein
VSQRQETSAYKEQAAKPGVIQDRVSFWETCICLCLLTFISLISLYVLFIYVLHHEQRPNDSMLSKGMPTADGMQLPLLKTVLMRKVEKRKRNPRPKSQSIPILMMKVGKRKRTPGPPILMRKVGKRRRNPGPKSEVFDNESERKEVSKDI